MEQDPDLKPALLLALAVLEHDDLVHAAARCREAGTAAAVEDPTLGVELRRRIDELTERGAVEEELERCAALDLELVHWRDARYPEGLHDLSAPPPVLYLRGRGAWQCEHAVTIVGARRSTPVGRSFARELGQAISARGAAVVSGLAVGVDQCAHEGALSGTGPLIAVLACGVDRIYPPGARGLARAIEDRGRLISEMPLETPPYRSHFPRRNRILAALSRSIVVVEADLRSGSLITAHRALELGREIYAVPGSIDRPTSRGTNRLIRDGAYPLLTAEDADLLVPTPAGRSAPAPTAHLLLEALQTPAAPEDLARTLELPEEEVLLKLLDLELEGQVRHLGGGLYARSLPRLQPLRQQVAAQPEHRQGREDEER